MPAEVDLDRVRQRLVELDDRQRGVPAADIACRHALHEATDGLRTMLRNGSARSSTPDANGGSGAPAGRAPTNSATKRSPAWSRR